MPASDYVVEKTTLISGRGQGNLEEWRFENGEVAHRSRVYVGKKQPLQTWRGLNRTQAKKKHNERLFKVGNGEKPAERLYIADVMVEAFDHLDNLARRGDGSEGTVGNYRSAWKKRIADEPIGSARLDQIDRAACLRFLRNLRDSDLASSTQNGTVSALRTVLRYAREMDYMTGDPFAGIARKEFPPQKPSTGIPSKALDNSEGQRLVEAARSEKFRAQTDSLYTNIVVVARYQGPRSGELCGLHWRDIDLLAEEISFIGQQARDQKVGEPVKIVPPKNKEAGKRKPRMHPEVWAALNDQLVHEQSKGLGRPDDLVFTTIVGGPITRSTLLLAVKRAGKLAGLGRVVTKDLRTSWVTAAVHSGLAPVEIETMTGHTAAVVERFYAKPIRTAQQAKENVDRMVANGF